MARVYSNQKAFSDLLDIGIQGGKIPGKTQAARDWYRERARNFKDINRGGRFLRNAEEGRFKKSMDIGHMYLYEYDAKHKDTLPYWDRFPLVFPIGPAKGGFLGINLHYLPYKYRAILMDALYDLSTSKRYDQKVRLKITYDVLKSASKFRYFKPTVKHYLHDHMSSRFYYIHPSEWDIALFLPLSQFQKAHATTVWKDSRRIIKGN